MMYMDMEEYIPSVTTDWEQLLNGQLDGSLPIADELTLYPDNHGAVEKPMTDDTVSYDHSSSAASWNCLDSGSLSPAEKQCHFYDDISKIQPTEIDSLLSDELIADIASSLADYLPESLEEFCSFEQLGDGDVVPPSIPSSSYYPNTTVDGMQNCDLISELSVPEYSEEMLDNDSSTSAMDEGSSVYTEDTSSVQYLSDNETNLECEEVYDDAICTVDDKAIHYEPSFVFSDQVAEPGLEFQVQFPVQRLDQQPSDNSFQSVPFTSDRKQRKKEQNKTAALRYRLKKRSEQGVVLTEYTDLERKNIELKTRLDSMSREVLYLKSLIDELCS